MTEHDDAAGGPDGGAAFADVVRAWHARGEPVPVAVVASVFDDVLATSVRDEGSETLALDDLRVTSAGAAALTRPAHLDAVSPLLMEALGADLLGDHAVPPAAWRLLDRLTSDDPTERPADAEQLRDWLRDSLGAPASHEEVRDCVFHALMGTGDPEPAVEVPEPAPSDDVHELEVPEPAPSDDVHELETLPPHPAAPLPYLESGADDDEALPVPAPAADEAMATLPPERTVEDHQVSTDVVRRREVPRDPGPSTDVERATHLPEPLPDSLGPGSETVLPTTIDGAPPSAVLAARAEVDDDAPAPEPVSPDPILEETAMPAPLESELDAASAHPTVPEGGEDRPVVRHALPRQARPVSVVSAPAARRSARSSPLGGDSILQPADQRRGWVWVGVIAALSAAVYFLFFR